MNLIYLLCEAMNFTFKMYLVRINQKNRNYRAIVISGYYVTNTSLIGPPIKRVEKIKNLFKSSVIFFLAGVLKKTVSKKNVKHSA